MRVLYCHDNFYLQKGDAIYSAGQFPYTYWHPYLQAFDELIVTGRHKEFPPGADMAQFNKSSGDNVNFSLYPNINTPQGLLKHYWAVRQKLKQDVEQADAVIVRAVSDLGWISFQHAKALGKPVAMEMAACAWDATWNHGNMLGKIYAPLRYIHDRIVTRYADFVLYVSQDFLPSRYPTNGEVTFASNVRIERPEDDVIEKRIARYKALKDKKKPLTIGLIGTLNHKLKGVSTALKAVKELNRGNPGAYLFRHLGPGDPEKYEAESRKLGIDESVYFDGMMKSGDAVMEWLDGIDIYIQPSFQEGVPRAMIEAMSRACPAVGSSAGGIPELLDRRWLHKPGDHRTLAEKIDMLGADPKTYLAEASVNFDRAPQFSNEVLMPKRIAFWQAFRDHTIQRCGAKLQTART